MRRGETVLRSGQELRASDLGLLAEVGRDRVTVIPRPTVAIISTGNELVPAAHLPGPGQIRNSNGPMLAALVQSAGAAPRDLGIVRDELDDLRRVIAQGLQADVLVLSGGVSAGVLDLVPRVLAEAGVQQVFHKVNLKPGKPLWFGAKGNAEFGMRNSECGDGSSGIPNSEFRIPHSKTLVFGLPGNPASTLVCFELFVRPALRRLAGHVEVRPPVMARLDAHFNHRGNRPTYHPGRLEQAPNGAGVVPVRWQGSADLRALALANCLIHFPAGDQEYPPGKEVEVIAL
jgi:molybdopterin molybdotransferase